MNDNEKQHPENVALKGSAEFKGPGDKRGCTDILCALLLIASWLVMTYIGMLSTGILESDSLKKGDPYRLINGIDFNANICGVDSTINARNVSIEDLPKAYYLPSGSPVCIADCPTVDNFDLFYCKYQEDAYIEQQALLEGPVDSEAYTLLRYKMSAFYSLQYSCMPHVATRDVMGYCVPEAAIDALMEQASAALNANIKSQCTTTVSGDGYTDSSGTLVLVDDQAGSYWRVMEDPVNCTASRLGIEVTSDFLDPASEDGFFDRIGSDLFVAQQYIMGFGLGVAMILGFLYLFILRIPGVLASMVWGLIAVVFFCLFGIGGAAYLKSQEWADEENSTHSDSEITGLLYFAYFFFGAAGIWFFFICCCLRRRIMLAIACVKEAAKAIAAMPIITIYPVFQVVGVVLFLLPWMTYVAFLASSGDVVADCICPSIGSIADTATHSYNMAASAAGEDPIVVEKVCEEGCFTYKTFSYDDNTRYAGLYLLFCWFWTSQFIIAAGQLVVAMSVSMWYFTKEKKSIGNITFWRACKKAMYYHLGTAAFGSLVIAIIKTIRAIISYIQKKAKKSKYAKAVQVILCALQCYMWCIEKCAKFLNKNAYIQTAIFGYSFCKAAKQAFFLILRNILRITAVAIVSEFVLIIGKLFIMVGSTLLCYLAMESQLESELNYLWFPTMIVALVSYFTADMFNEVFGMAISTILQCFVADEEMFPDPADRFAEGGLAATINKTNTEAQQQAKGKGAGAVHPAGEDALP